jgi:hypothetical protein
MPVRPDVHHAATWYSCSELSGAIGNTSLGVDCQRITILILCPLNGSSHQASVAAGYNYQNSDQRHVVRANLNGWFASAQFDFNNTVSLSAEADNYYGSLRGVGMLQQDCIVGPQFTFGSDRTKVRPLGYTQAGDQRSA